MMLVMRRQSYVNPELQRAQEETNAGVERAERKRRESREVVRQVERLRTSNGLVLMFTKLLGSA